MYCFLSIFIKNNVSLYLDMKFKDISQLIYELKNNSKRLIKVQLLSNFILKNNVSYVDSMKLFDILSGTFSREISKKELGISLKTVLSALASFYEINSKDLEKDFFNHGDIFKTIKTFDKTPKSIISTDSNLTLNNYISTIIRISQTSGKNSTAFKKEILISLFSQTKAQEERAVLVALICDLLKIGVNEGVLLDAFSFTFFPKIPQIHHKDLEHKFFVISPEIDINSSKDLIYSNQNFNNFKIIDFNSIQDLKKYSFPFDNLELNITSQLTPREIQIQFRDLVERVYNFNVSFQTTFEKLKDNVKNIFHPPIIFKKPIQVMLGPRLYSFDEVNKRIEFPIFCDYKYDGLRLIVQNNFGEVTLFSRNLENLTSQFPEVVTFIQKNFSNVSCVLDGECIGYNKQTKQILPFQELSKRIMTKSHNLKVNYFIGIKFFDLLELNSELIYEYEFSKRQQKLSKLFNNQELIQEKFFQSDDLKENLENYFKENK